MISRTLGPQLGGSVGVLFYAANVVSGALYAAGFAETLTHNFGPMGNLIPDILDDSRWHKFAYASGVVGVCLVISLIGAKAFSKATIVFMVLLMVSLGDLGISFAQNDNVSGTAVNSEPIRMNIYIISAFGTFQLDHSSQLHGQLYL